MKLYILAVGNKMPEWIVAGFTEYHRRMPKEMSVQLIEIKPEKRGAAKQAESLLLAESERIRAALPIHCYCVAMDELGKGFTTIELAGNLVNWMREGLDIAFIIGGADGLHRDIKRTANEIWSLSKLTLPHGLVRVLLAEQLYRAMSIIKQHPYHRA
ncbi:MAG TPA: 23S rRNA (pseudouridine(1915)-N(3))-methyltransferase RlmH [Nitrosomonas nitrosa]|nr:23S rRNA (pseudouridine(1915)-N(3))-methyltransferase RlmH [Nitrosomonas nitrosa]HNP50735.1 23S rRNA (pseudouridine(1915)-N(3))-methyltransferase RlmH [Nitrosomonas nitrosa]